MTQAGLPSLKTSPPDLLYEIDQLATHPDRWRTAPVSDLGQTLVVHASLWARGGCPQELSGPLMGLHRIFAERASEAEKVGVLDAIGRYAEESSRESQSGHQGMACALFLRDSSPVVASTAALLMASLIQPPGGAEMAGPKSVVDLVLDTEDGTCRAAGLAGLLAIGERRMTALLDGCWKHLDNEDRGVLAQLGTGQFPTPAKVDFFLTWAETAIESNDEENEGLGIAAAGLVNLARRAEQLGPNGEPFGVLEIDRAFPAWSRPFDSVVRVTRRWSKEEFAETISPRLTQIARTEHPPRVGPTVLRAWGLPDVPHIEAVATAVRRRTDATGDFCMLAPPLEVDTHPDREQPNQILEWGIINPHGPTMCQVSLVDLGLSGHALVWTMHHFLAPACLVLAAGHLQDVNTLHEALAQVFAANGGPEYSLFKSLPHWVRIPADGPLEMDALAGLIASANRRQLVSDGLKGDGPDAAMETLSRLGEDPIREINRQEIEAINGYAPVMRAMSAGDNETAAALLRALGDQPSMAVMPDDAAYRRWLRFACEPAYVEKVRSYFDSAWKEAIRRYNAFDVPPRNGDGLEQS